VRYPDSSDTFYKWKLKCDGLEASGIKRLRELELENNRLKRLLGNTMLNKEILKDVIETKCWGPSRNGSA
jgi:putative transposase